MSRQNLFAVFSLIVAVAVAIPGCSVLFDELATPVDNINFDACFQRLIENPDGTRQATQLTLITGEKPEVDGTFRVLDGGPAQNQISKRVYSLGGEATKTDEAKFTATPTERTPGDPQKVTVTLDLQADTAQVQMDDGSLFTAMLNQTCPLPELPF